MYIRTQRALAVGVSDNADPEYLDGKYWKEKGWLAKNRPWKKERI